jgi:hypothetical protein
MDVNASHKQTPKGRIVHQIQPIRGTTQGTLAGKNQIKIATDGKFGNYGKMISDNTVEIQTKY